MTIEVLTEKLYTLQEFFELGLDEEYELIEGKLVAKSGSGISAEHGEVIGRLMYFFNDYLYKNPVARAFDQASCTLGRPDKSIWVEPDVSIVLKERIPAKFKGPIPVAPDIVVEVWSPSDDTEKIQSKIDYYLAAGVRIVWSIHMISRYVVVCRLDAEEREFLERHQELDGKEILPGFKLAINKIFT